MNATAYKFHEVANIFPLMQGEEFEALKADIKEHGLREPIWTHKDRIIDGRNRYKACEDLGINPITREWDGNGSLVSFVVSLNLKRRHLTSGQKAALAVDILPMLEAEAKERRLFNLKRGDHKPVTEKIPGRAGESRHHAAQITKTNDRYVSDAKKVKESAPQLFEKVKSGEVKLPDAIREVKRKEVRANLESIETRKVKEISGVYDVIVVDPPWPMQKIERDERPNQVGLDYPTWDASALSAICKYIGSDYDMAWEPSNSPWRDKQPIDFKIPAAEDCHVWLWTTQRFLPTAFALLGYWGFNYVCTFVWHKPGGFQPVNLPQFNCEFALYGRHGSPKFLDTKALPTCFQAPRGKHSEKPEAFYELVRRVTAGRRLDMFNRREIEGFDRWGKEA